MKSGVDIRNEWNTLETLLIPDCCCCWCCCDGWIEDWTWLVGCTRLTKGGVDDTTNSLWALDGSDEECKISCWCLVEVYAVVWSCCIGAGNGSISICWVADPNIKCRILCFSRIVDNWSHYTGWVKWWVELG